jgi:activator of HSP90 ATPase
VFKCFGGQITGRIIELVPNRRIIQVWHVAMWPEGVYSVVKFEVQKRDSERASSSTTRALRKSIATTSMLDGHECIGSA